MKLIVETDLGRDSDDFFALCYLIDAGVDLRLITISPGDPDQVAVARFLVKECGLDIPIGVSNTKRNKRSVGGMHTELLKKYKFPLEAISDGCGGDLMIEIFKPKEHPHSHIAENLEFFGCGPLDSLGKLCNVSEPLFLESSQLITGGPLSLPNSPLLPKRATVQGGYVSYEMLAKAGIEPPIKLDKFIGKDFVTTFNLCGNIQAGLAFLKSSIPEKRFVSKNLCHTIVYDKEVHDFVTSHKPKSRAGELLREGMDLYLQKHSGKKFHDPSAAVCHLHPEIGQWVDGQLIYDRGKWGTILENPNCKIIGTLDYSKLWEHIAVGN